MFAKLVDALLVAAVTAIFYLTGYVYSSAYYDFYGIRMGEMGLGFEDVLAQSVSVYASIFGGSDPGWASYALRIAGFAAFIVTAARAIQCLIEDHGRRARHTRPPGLAQISFGVLAAMSVLFLCLSWNIGRNTARAYLPALDWVQIAPAPETASIPGLAELSGSHADIDACQGAAPKDALRLCWGLYYLESNDTQHFLIARHVLREQLRWTIRLPRRDELILANSPQAR
ncbi:hypothetical protein SAMN05421538_10973 [Paracoccus isoporae]|uniref:Uncharacterized protein n=1 Tax=Paracoccus isoporae TaxID=591205 RepID=A0A1G7ETT5_9RHOB|nr:hypothetical protein [Paracoccus isoporae]SDE66987.1 hypothetical protein SAMN05421538_10973 [Paracoccus isoporae]